MINAAKVALHKLFSTRTPRGDEDGSAPDSMGFFQHLEELRKTLFRCCLAFAVSAGLSLVYYKKIFVWLRYPLEKAVELDNLKLSQEVTKTVVEPEGGPAAGLSALWELVKTGHLPETALPARALTLEHAASHLQLLKLIDVFTVLMDVILFGGIALSFPFILWSVAHFVSPALTTKEKKLIRPVLGAAIALFFAGAALAFFWLMPISIQFSMSLARDFGTPLNWTAEDYYSFTLMMPLLVGLVFEFPLLIVGLQYLEITNTRWLFSIWRQALVGILVVAIVFTPLGDPLSVCILTGVLFMLYLGSILIGDRLVKMKHRRSLAYATSFDEDEDS